MKRGRRTWLHLLLLLLLFSLLAPAAQATEQGVDLEPRLKEIFTTRAQHLLTRGTPPPIEGDYLTGLKTAQWALQHERGKLRYMEQWAKNRGVSVVEASPSIGVKYLGGGPDRARFYVGQSMAIGYTYDGESTVNRFGVGTRHIIELRRKDGRWFIGMEWYTDPLGDDTEVPDVTPALVPAPLLPPALPVANQTTRKGYDRAGAVAYADKYCGLAWGCGNNQKYNPKYRDYNGVGGDCTNYISQALRDGGTLKSVPIMTRVSGLAGHLQYSGRAQVIGKAPFQELWRRATQQAGGFPSMLDLGDLIAYQEKGKLEHFAIITGFDSRGYPLINSHTADRYHVPFDLGWDRKTVYWLFRMRG